MRINSKFRLHINTSLSSSDYKVLALLYQPLIGVDAYAIYSTFYHLVKGNEIDSHQLLFDLLNITMDDFKKAITKLEALGLIETYINSKKDYVYIIKPPYSAKKFLTDTFLGAYLESEIGTKNLENIIKVFKVNKPDLTNYKNITKSFDEVYQVHTKKLLNISDDLEGRNGFNNQLIRNGINYNEFIERLPRALKSPVLFNDNFKQKLIQLAFVYQFNVDDLVLIYKNASKGNTTATIEQINLQARLYYEKNNEVITIQKKTTSDTEVIKDLSFRTVVDKFVVDDPILRASSLDTINNFIAQNDVDLGVLNVLLIFILKNKEGVLPHVNYLNKVWESWAKAGVRTAEDAINHREQLEKTWKSRAPKENKPDWLDEYMKELEELEEQAWLLKKWKKE